eukprot:SAG25_NODE_150_length_13701_cov_6.145640_15_plen_82_part_00
MAEAEQAIAEGDFEKAAGLLAAERQTSCPTCTTPHSTAWRAGAAAVAALFTAVLTELYLCGVCSCQKCSCIARGAVVSWEG